MNCKGDATRCLPGQERVSETALHSLGALDCTMPIRLAQVGTLGDAFGMSNYPEYQPTGTFA